MSKGPSPRLQRQGITRIEGHLPPGTGVKIAQPFLMVFRTEIEERLRIRSLEKECAAAKGSSPSRSE